MGKIKYIKVKDTTNNSKIDFKQILKGVVLATVMAIMLLIVGAAVFTYTNISMTFINTVAGVVFYVCAFISGIISSVKLKVYGWMHGILSGCVYAIILFIINILSDGTGQNLYLSLLKIIFSAVAGGTGGIIGVNLHFSQKRR